jgi:hypothetical protein
MAEAWSHGPARRLDELLETAEITNVTAGEKLGLHNSTVQRYRKGRATPPADHLAALVEMAGGSADWVLGIKAGDLAAPAAALYDAAERVLASAPDVRRGASRARRIPCSCHPIHSTGPDSNAHTSTTSSPQKT